jgi:hypothetical protein
MSNTESGRGVDPSSTVEGEHDRAETGMPSVDGAPGQAEDRELSSATRISDTGALQELNQDPDVILDVKDVRIGLIEFALQELDAHVSLRAEVSSLVKVSVGAEVHVGSVRLTIKEVHVPAYLQVKLGKLHAILSRALTTIDRNPKLLEALGKAVSQVGGGLGQTLPEVGGRLGQGLESLTGGLGQTLPRVAGELPRAGRLRSGVRRMVSWIGGGFGRAARIAGGPGRMLAELSRSLEEAGRGIGKAAEAAAQNDRPQRA